MIHVIITMLPVPSDAIQVLKSVQILNQRINLAVCIEIGGIRFLNLGPTGVKDCGMVIQHADLLKL